MADVEQVFQRHVGAFNDHSVDAFPWVDEIEFFAPGAQMHGREEVYAFMRGFWTAFPDAQLTILRAVFDGTRGAAEGRFAGTHEGPLRTPAGEVPPTGRRVDFPWLAMYEFEGDRLASEHLYFDQAELAGQLGLGPG